MIRPVYGTANWFGIRLNCLRLPRGANVQHLHGYLSRPARLSSLCLGPYGLGPLVVMDHTNHNVLAVGMSHWGGHYRSWLPGIQVRRRQMIAMSGVLVCSCPAVVAFSPVGIQQHK